MTKWASTPLSHRVAQSLSDADRPPGHRAGRTLSGAEGPRSSLQHRNLARGRWRDLSLAEQFGNVGSEISRAIRWSTKNPETAQAALYRGLELFDLMLDDPQHRGSVARLGEIARAREVVVDFLAGSNEYRSTGPSLQKYFDQFVLAARRAHLAQVGNLDKTSTPA